MTATRDAKNASMNSKIENREMNKKLMKIRTKQILGHQPSGKIGI
jgi:hypothetical protein